MKGICTLNEMQRMEVINVRDGKRLGCVCDVEINCDTGQLESIIVPGPSRFFGLLGREADYIIPWREIQKMGRDIILVCFDPPEVCESGKKEKKKKLL